MTKQAMIASCTTAQYPEKLIAPMLDAAMITLRIIDYDEIPDDMVEAVKKEIDTIKSRLENLTANI